MARSKRPLSEISAGFTRFPQALVNIGVAQKRPLEELATVQEAISDVESELGNEGRVLIRYSGTENKARVMVEGREEARVHELAQSLASTLKQALGGA